MTYQIIITVILALVLLHTLINLGCLYSLRWRILKNKAAQLSEEDLPLISVLIPARNEELRIEPCLRSLLAQAFQEQNSLKTGWANLGHVINSLKKPAKVIVTGSSLPTLILGTLPTPYELLMN